jgi:uncharacterized membrane protein YjfL (UPF0719 family)
VIGRSVGWGAVNQELENRTQAAKILVFLSSRLLILPVTLSISHLNKEINIMADLFFSGVQFLVAIVAAAIVAYLSIWLFDKATRGLDEWNELRKGNLAVGVVLGAMLIGVGIVLRPALAPLALNLDATTTDAVAYRILLHGVQVLVGIVLAVVSLGLSLWLFTRLTGSIDEWAEIGRGNVAIAAVLAGVIVATALITSTTMDAVLVLIVR